MNNKVLYEVNTVLNIFRNDLEFAKKLLCIYEDDIFINASELIPGYLDYFYKTTWLFNCNPVDMPYTFGIIENGDIILLKDDESMPNFCCNGLQNLPMYLLESRLYEEPQERCILIERRMQLKNEKYTDCLKEFAQRCRNANVELHKLYDYNLERDVISSEMSEEIYNTKTQEQISFDTMTGEGPGCYPQWNKGEMYYPCVTRPFLKPVTKLFTPRILTGELNYPDVPLVKHMVDGDNTDFDKKYEQI